MPKIIKNGREYSGVPLEEVTAWPPTGDSVQIEQPLMGNTDISEVGDGTVTGAIAQNAEDITELNKGSIPLIDSLNLDGAGRRIVAFNANSTDTPVARSQGVCIYVGDNWKYRAQVAFTNNGNFYVRNSSGGDYSAWKRVKFVDA